VGNRVKLLWGVLIASVHGHPMERLLAQIRGGLAPFPISHCHSGSSSGMRWAIPSPIRPLGCTRKPGWSSPVSTVPPSGRSTRVVMVWISRAHKASICARSPTSCALLALGAELGLNLLELHAELLQLCLATASRTQFCSRGDQRLEHE
jgi:hypothetical protein